MAKQGNIDLDSYSVKGTTAPEEYKNLNSRKNNPLCKTCQYRDGNMSYNRGNCDYIGITGNRRKHDGDKCLSYIEGDRLKVPKHREYIENLLKDEKPKRNEYVKNKYGSVSGQHYEGYQAVYQFYVRYITEHLYAPTLDEVTGGTGLAKKTVCKARAELIKAGLLNDAGQERANYERVPVKRDAITLAGYKLVRDKDYEF